MTALALSDRPVAADDLSDLERRVLDATNRCISRWGVAKTTLEDVAREAGCSRASVYRAFPGGKDALVQRLVQRELTEFFTRIDSRLAAAGSLEDLVVSGIVEASTAVLDHVALQYLLQFEPEAILPHVSFTRFDEVLATATDFAAPHLERWLDPQQARRSAEWVTRVVVSYVMCPSPGVDLRDEDSVRQLVRHFILPGLTRIQGAATA
ncbi:MAG: TetR/AcrR family transcriptional regulator [Acidimicrobiia bacterium]